MAGENKLTEKEVKLAKPKDKSYRLADGGGMYLEVMPNGSKYWRLKYRIDGREKRLALGVYPDVTLATARVKYRAAKDGLAEGLDPNQTKKNAKLSRQAATQNSFAAIGQELVTKRQQEGAARVTLEKLNWILDKKLCPHIGGISVAELTPVQLLTTLRKIEAEGLHETASRAKRVASQVIRYAIATGRAERDICQDLNGALVTAKVTHRAAITRPEELAPLLIAIDSYKGTPEVTAALKLTPLLFQRPGEIRHMEWAEVNWEAAYWEIQRRK